VEQAFFRECEMLQIHLPDVIPRSSTSVESAVELVKILLQKGHAYWHDGEVFFDPLSYPGFGKLFGLDMSKWPEKRVRFRKDTYPGQRWNYGDFILWRKRTPEDGEVFWETQLGQGRPAWNIQDAGMIAKHLGFELDIHTGGVDNLYRHHDYTLAIMECASGKVLAPYWLHGEHVTVEGAKMSKSKGNVLYVEDLLDKGFYPRHLRFGLLYGAHYRDRIDVSTEELKKQARRLDSTREIAHGLLSGRIENENDEAGEDFAGSLRRAFEAKMADDLDYNGAFEAVVRELSRAAAADREGGLTERRRQELRAALCDVDRVLGVLGCG
jgi:cysteinyl-tRNA synthetase